jgi:hypothetical protein
MRLAEPASPPLQVAPEAGLEESVPVPGASSHGLAPALRRAWPVRAPHVSPARVQVQALVQGQALVQLRSAETPPAAM